MISLNKIGEELKKIEQFRGLKTTTTDVLAILLQISNLSFFIWHGTVSYSIQSYFDMCLFSPLPWLLLLTSPFTLILFPSSLVLVAGSLSIVVTGSPPSGMESMEGEVLSFCEVGSSGEGDFLRISWRRLRVCVCAQKYEVNIA